MIPDEGGRGFEGGACYLFIRELHPPYSLGSF